MHYLGYHFMQLQGKLPIFFFFFSPKIWLSQLLDIVVNYHHVKYQKKTNDPILKITV